MRQSLEYENDRSFHWNFAAICRTIQFGRSIMASNIAASVAAKLKNYAKANGHDVMVVFRRYAQERFLYRLSVSPYADIFCLKGGMLLAALNDGDLKRPTYDIDLGYLNVEGDIALLKEILLSIITQDVADDGVIFVPETMRVAKDRDGTDGNHWGGKIVLNSLIHTARVEVRIDVGSGNVITPHVNIIKMPSLMQDIAPAPVLSAYPIETVVSEKLHAMVQHGLINTRMKDYFDLMQIADKFELKGDVLRQAVISTFEGLRRDLPEDPVGLSDRMITANRKQWAGYIKRLGIHAPDDFGEVVERVSRFIQPVISAAHGAGEPGDWSPDGAWSETQDLKP
jgi:predicted nucleotidyltransferase component of viral defense system